MSDELFRPIPEDLQATLCLIALVGLSGVVVLVREIFRKGRK